MNHQHIEFSSEELARYNRHILLPGFGMEGQQKLKAAKVLVIGAGGLGSPALLYLAAAGIGHIGIVDFDAVDESNLQRQALYSIDDVGTSKTEAAARRLKALNPHIHLRTYKEPFSAQNAMALIKEYDVVIDGSDNFPTRYLVNDACVLSSKPYVYAAVSAMEGQLTVFNYANAEGEIGPNYRDLYPLPPTPEAVPDCATGGVLGVLPGIIGTMQALEAIKIITGLGECLSGRLLLFNALTSETNIFRIRRNQNNPLNGDEPTIKELIYYDLFCASSNKETLKEIMPAELQQLIDNAEDFQLIDVREPAEYELVNIGAELIPLSSIAQQMEKISRHKKVIIHCKSGKRSADAIRQLQIDWGYNNLYNLKGGIIAYIKEIRPQLPLY